MTAREQLNENIIEQLKGLRLDKEARKAVDRFKETGLPHKKLENYKYTNVDAFFPLNLKLESRKIELSTEQVLESSKGLIPQLAYINGVFSEEHSNLPEGVELIVSESCPSILEFDTDSLEDLNLALAHQIIKLIIPENYSGDVINIVHLSTPEATETLKATRLLLEVGTNSLIKVVEIFNSPNSGIYNRNHMTQVVAKENSNVEHIKVVTEGIESFHFGSLKAEVKANAYFHSFTFTTGGSTTRNNINVDLKGIGARGDVNGLYALRGDQHCDNFSHINHSVERTESEQLFKAVLDNNSHGIFTGKIIVHRDAQLVNSAQLNKNLLLSKKAHADTRPQLEVYADDVKCAHGATVGQLSEDELFYLESRAISPKDARVMLCHGFVQEALNKIKHLDTRKFLENLLYTEYEKDIHERIREGN